MKKYVVNSFFNDRLNDQRTDGPMDGPTDSPSYRDARSHLKSRFAASQRKFIHVSNIVQCGTDKPNIHFIIYVIDHEINILMHRTVACGFLLA